LANQWNRHHDNTSHYRNQNAIFRRRCTAFVGFDALYEIKHPERSFLRDRGRLLPLEPPELSPMTFADWPSIG
jgi:hypothetical protein